ncbi:MAG: hypothetical protein ISS36_01070 [Candidatus Aenigmarchaeota archaeon]|nr:hypothetical protein [Candidatus Aenigmarchaeota archaeon]
MDKISVHIIRNLYYRGYIGRRHTNISHLKQGLPKHLQDMTTIKKKLKELQKIGILIIHKKGEQVSLNYIGETKSKIDMIINAKRTDSILD